jgi:signal transduction histidine kinase
VNTELENALHSKDQMIQNVSHELRTPLGIIYGYTEVLLETSDQGPLTPEQARILQAMLQQGERLRFMVERILALQTFDAQQLQLQQIQLDCWLPGMVSRWESRASRPTRGPAIRFEVECSASPILGPILADAGLLQQVMVNLLDNAQKFSPNGGTVHISVRAEGDYAILAVSDQGIGIPPEKLSHVFERFYQVDGSATRRYGGMGIGLAFCRTIVEAHGGRIWAESQGEGYGSTFYILLPKASSQEESL